MNPSSTIHPPLLYLVMGIFTLAGCASMNEKECKTADWRLIGYEDGIVGRSTIQLKEHREACAEHGVSPDLDLYLTGHREGMMVYCRPVNAFSLGRGGHAYPAICPAKLEDELRPAYRDGAKVHQYRSRVKKVQQRLTNKRRRYDENDQTLADYQKELIGRKTSNDRRLELLAETVTLSKRQDRLKEEITVLEEKLHLRRRELKRLEDSLHC